VKILILTNLFPLPWEPNRAAFNRQQFESLAQDCEVKVIVVVSFIDFFRNFSKTARHTRNGIDVEYLCYFYIPGFARFTYATTLFFTLLFKLRQIRKFAPDCALLSWAYPDAVAGTALARLLNIPTVIKVHGSDINMHAQMKWRAGQILWSMQKAAAVMSVSRDLAEKIELLGVNREKVHVIYNGVNKAKFRPAPRAETRRALNLPQEREIIVFVGNLKPEKGCNDLLEAFSILAERRHSVDLYFIGSGSSAEFIQAKAASSGLGKRVHMVGSISHDKLPHWICCSNLIALPSHNEGVPNVLLESMACGIPVVATRVGGIPEVVSSEAGILCQSQDITGLVNALNDCLDKDWNSQAILDSVDKFSWENNRSEVLDLLKSASN